MGLGTFEDLGTEKHGASLSNRGLERDHSVLEITLTPAPSAAQRCLRIEPANSFHARSFGARACCRCCATAVTPAPAVAIPTPGSRLTVTPTARAGALPIASITAQ